MSDRFPYTHHGPAVYGSKLADYLISEANMRADDAEPCCMSAAHGQACACAERDALRAERDMLRAVLGCIAGAALKAGYGSPSSWGDSPPTRFEFGKDTGEPLTPEQACHHDNGVIDAYREVRAAARAALGDPTA